MMKPAVPTTDLIPDPLTICSRIRQLNSELRLARRLLRLSHEAWRQQPESGVQPAKRSGSTRVR